MNAYTKGPWHIVKKHYGNELESVDLNGDGDHVGIVNIYGEADASLIAAAPDLAEALEAIERAIHDRNYFAIESAFDAGGFGCAALRKARGEQP